MTNTDELLLSLTPGQPVSSDAVTLFMRLADVGITLGVVGGRLLFVWGSMTRFEALTRDDARELVRNVDRHRAGLARLVAGAARGDVHLSSCS